MDGWGDIVIIDGMGKGLHAVAPKAFDAAVPIGRRGPKDCSGLIAIPGLVDACVHIGEPGAEHRETIRSASRAGGAWWRDLDYHDARHHESG